MPATKAQIIGKMLKSAGPKPTSLSATADDCAGYTEEEVIHTLERSLAALTANCPARTCVDFSHLRVECCGTCHHFDSHFEMALIDIESGGSAWICCALDRALNPIQHAQRQSSPDYEELERMLKPDDSH